MVCIICGSNSGILPFCRNCVKLKEEGRIDKCECGNFKKGIFPQCLECWRKNFKANQKIAANNKTVEYRAEDGHIVKSKAELTIDNWLYNKKVIHAYERRVPIDEELICDFFIPIGNVWIEYWGLDDDNYLKRKEMKQNLYKKNDKNLIELTDEELTNLDSVLPLKLRPYLPPNFSFD